SENFNMSDNETQDGVQVNGARLHFEVTNPEKRLLAEDARAPGDIPGGNESSSLPGDVLDGVSCVAKRACVIVWLRKGVVEEEGSKSRHEFQDQTDCGKCHKMRTE